MTHVMVEFPRWNKSNVRRRVIMCAMTMMLAIDTGIAVGQPPSFNRIHRRSADAENEIQRGLVSDGRFTDAVQRAQRLLGRVDANSDAAAHAVIDWAAANVAAERAGAAITESDQTLSPLTTMLASYPNHPRRLFLLAAENRLQLDRIEMTTALRLMNGADDIGNDLLSRQLVQLGQRCSDLATEARQLQTAAPSASLTDDYGRLRRSLIVRNVVIDRLQTRLYRDDSSDARAAAAAAVRSAETAIGLLPPTSSAAARTRLLLALSLEDAGLIEQAARRLESLPGDDPEVAALAMRLAIVNDQQRLAETIYQATSPPELPTDLALLRLRLRQGRPSDEIVELVDQIEQRHGAYARRLAEARTLERLNQSSSDNVGAAGLVAIQGADQIRRGNNLRGGRMMVAAAAGSTEFTEAAKYAITAAAALQNEAANEAIDVLVATADRFDPDGRTDSSANIGSLSTTGSPATTGSSATTGLLATTAIALAAKHQPDRLRTMLRWYVDRFAASDDIEVYRQWLVRTETQSGTPSDAALFSRGQDALQRWQTLFESADAGGNFDEVSDSYLQHLGDPRIEPEHAEDLHRWSGELLDVNELHVLGVIENEPPITRFRLGKSSTLDIADKANVWRLIRDGIRQPDRQSIIAKLLGQSSVSLNALQSATIATWNGQEDRAIEIINEELAKDSSIQTRRRAAAVFAMGSTSLRRKAVEIHDRIASGSKVGSDLWLTAKWNAIELLRTLDPGEAFKRAKYILLTNRQLDQSWRQRFESVTP